MRQVEIAQTRKHLTIEPLIAKELENTISAHENGRAMRINKAEAFVKRRSNEPPKRDKFAITFADSPATAEAAWFATFGRAASSQGSFAAPRGGMRSPFSGHTEISLNSSGQGGLTSVAGAA
jgi:hypothetical protein